MTQDILIRILGFHESCDENDEAAEPIEVIAPGTYYYKNGKHFILYEEVLDNVNTLIKNTVKIVSDQLVEVRKTGASNALMIYEPGKSNRTLYQTPYGTVDVDMVTDNIELSVDEEKIDLFIEYGMEVEGERLSRSRVEMNIRSACNADEILND